MSGQSIARSGARPIYVLHGDEIRRCSVKRKTKRETPGGVLGGREGLERLEMGARKLGGVDEGGRGRFVLLTLFTSLCLGVWYFATVTAMPLPSLSVDTVWTTPLPKVFSPTKIARSLSLSAPASTSLALAVA